MADKITTKDELIAAMAAHSGLTKADAGRALEAFMRCVEKELKAGHSVRLTGFGSFDVAHLSAREGRNPRTGEPLKIAASKSPKFKAGTLFKKAIA